MLCTPQPPGPRQQSVPLLPPSLSQLGGCTREKIGAQSSQVGGPGQGGCRESGLEEWIHSADAGPTARKRGSGWTNRQQNTVPFRLRWNVPFFPWAAMPGSHAGRGLRWGVGGMCGQSPRARGGLGADEKTLAPTGLRGQEPWGSSVLPWAGLPPGAPECPPPPSPRLHLRVRGARVAFEVAEVTRAVLQAEAGLVALGHLLACGCIQQVIVAELIHAVVMSEGKGHEERRGSSHPWVPELALVSLLWPGLPYPLDSRGSVVPWVPQSAISGAPHLAKSPWGSTSPGPHISFLGSHLH